MFGEHKPQSGDVTICLYCGHIMAFGKALELRSLTDEEMLEVAGDRRIVLLQKLRKHVMENDNAAAKKDRTG